MSLSTIYDELVGSAADALLKGRLEIDSRAALLREQICVRLERELGLSEHSFAFPVLTAYLANGIRLYLLGFYDASIVEVESRVASALHGRLHGTWERSGIGHAAGVPPSPAVTLALLIDQAESAGLFALPSLPHDRLAGLYAGLRELADKRTAIEARNRDQGLQITVWAPRRGALSGGPGAAHTEPILGYYLSWGANLHHLLIDAVLAVTLILAQDGAHGTASSG